MYLNMVLNYFYSFFENLSEARGETFDAKKVERILTMFQVSERDHLQLTHQLVGTNVLDPKTHFNALVADYDNEEKNSNGLSLDELALRKKEYRQELLLRMVKRFPSIENIEASPFESVQIILLSDDQKMGQSGVPIKDIQALYPTQAMLIERQLIKEFMNNSTRSMSTIQKILDRREEGAFWNLCLLVREFNFNENEEFFREFVREGAKMKIGRGLHFLFASSSNFRKSEDRFNRLFLTYIANASQQEMALMIKEQHNLGLFKTPEKLNLFMRLAGEEVKNQIRQKIKDELKMGPAFYSLAKYRTELAPYFERLTNADKCSDSLRARFD